MRDAEWVLVTGGTYGLDLIDEALRKGEDLARALGIPPSLVNEPVCDLRGTPRLSLDDAARAAELVETAQRRFLRY